MVELHTQVGRFVGVVTSGAPQLADFAAFRTEFTHVLARVNRRVVVAVDARAIELMRPEVVAALGRLMSMDNALIERAAYLVQTDSPHRPQFDALAEGGRNPGRRVFEGAGELRAFLAPALEPAEAVALGHFLAR